MQMLVSVENCYSAETFQTDLKRDFIFWFYWWWMFCSFWYGMLWIL